MSIYLSYKDGKVKGDVTSDGHEGWIEVDGIEWGVARGISSPVGKAANRESSAPSISEISLTKEVDKATVQLFQEALIGEGVDARIDFCKTDQGKLETYLSYLLENCMLSSYSVKGASG